MSRRLQKWTYKFDSELTSNISLFLVPFVGSTTLNVLAQVLSLIKETIF